MSGRKDKSAGNDKSLTVSEYSRQFFERTVNQAYGDTPEENEKLAGQNFLNLVRKLQEAGSKDDIKVPLRVLRDEIGRLYFGSAKQRTAKIDTLFKLYDALEAGAQEDLRSKDGKQAAAANQVLDELRQRFSRLVIGDTWEAWPELKLIALKRMHKYAVSEVQAAKGKVETSISSPPPTPSSGRLGMKKLSRSFSGASASSAGVGSWQAQIDDLGKAPGNRLLPLLKLLLIEDADLPEDTKQNLAAEAAESNGENGKAPAPALPPVPEPAPVSESLRSQPSGLSEAAEVNRRVSELNMDDLLGLNDPIVEEKPEDTSDDPFQVSPGSKQAEADAAVPPPELPSGVTLEAPPTQQQGSFGAQNGIHSAPDPYTPPQPQQTYQMPQQPQQAYQMPQQPQQAYQMPQQPQQAYQMPQQPQQAYQMPQQSQQGYQMPQQPQQGYQMSQQPPQGYNIPPTANPFGQTGGYQGQAANGNGMYNLSPQGSSGVPTPHAFPPQHNFQQYAAPQPQQQQQPHQFAAFEKNAFGSQTAFTPNSDTGPTMHTVGSGTLPGGNGSSGQASQPGFNPFGLPAPTYNQAAPPSYADNTFADFSPLTPAPPPPAPQPMRNVLQPPSSNTQQAHPQFSQAPATSTFGSW